MNRLVLFCDGASRGNPGPAAYGFAIYQGEDLMDKAGANLGTATNNVAEYRGVIEGLKRCLKLGADSVTVKCDSELVVRQLNGQYKVKSPGLVPLHEEASELLQRFRDFKVLHVRREQNEVADQLANDSLDGKL